MQVLFATSTDGVSEASTAGCCITGMQQIQVMACPPVIPTAFFNSKLCKYSLAPFSRKYEEGFLLYCLSLKDMSGPIKILPYYTYEDYVQWEGRWELINGIPYAMSPAPTLKHQLIANTLGALFYAALKDCKTCKAYQAIDFKISEDTIVQPDISILCQATTKKFIDFPPALVVEILSPAAALKDRHTKSGLYAKQQVPYYIIISPDTEEAEVYMLENGSYVLKQKSKAFQYTFQLGDSCTATIDFSEIWK